MPLVLDTMAEEEIPIRRASGRVKAAVNYDEIRIFQDMTGLQDDIKHDIKHEVVSVEDAEENDCSENEESGSSSSDDIWCSPEILDSILEGSGKADIYDDGESRLYFLHFILSHLVLRTTFVLVLTPLSTHTHSFF